jgi:hypothetical protein
MTGFCAPPDTSAQLMQLRQTKALRIFNNHKAGIRDVNANFDDSRRDQQLQVALFESAHDRGFFCRLHTAMNQANGQIG